MRNLNPMLINGTEKYYPEGYINTCLGEGTYPTESGFLEYIQLLRVTRGYTEGITSHETFF